MPVSEQEINDAFNKVFWDWKNATPEAFEYVKRTGHSVVGLQNMLFHFYKAGFDRATPPPAPAGFYVKCDASGEDAEYGDPNLWYVMDAEGPVCEAGSRAEAEALLAEYQAGAVAS